MKKTLFPKFCSNERGSISVEAGFIITMLFVLSIGVVDFSLALTHNMQMKNAIRSGLQYAIVRKPSSIRDADGTPISVDLSDIITAVVTTAPSEEIGRTRSLSAELFCRCDDGTELACLEFQGVEIDCLDGSESRSFVRINFHESYELLFNYPGFPDRIKLGDTQEIRLN